MYRQSGLRFVCFLRQLAIQNMIRSQVCRRMRGGNDMCEIRCYLCCSVAICVVPCFVCLQMCTVLLPPCDNPMAVNKYIMSYHIMSYHIIYHIVSHYIISYIISYQTLFHLIYYCLSTCQLRILCKSRTINQKSGPRQNGCSSIAMDDGLVYLVFSYLFS